jgi:hypothetical protein
MTADYPDLNTLGFGVYEPESTGHAAGQTGCLPMAIDYSHASTEEPEQMLRGTLRDHPPGRETILRNWHKGS